MKSILKMLFLVGVVGLMVSCSGLGISMWEDPTVSQKVSGMGGQVLRGPIHGGPVHIGEVSEEGFAALFYVRDSGRLVTSFQSEPNGLFHVNIAPGTYDIVPDASAPIINAAQQVRQVIVAQGKITIDTLHFDTGLR